MEIQAQKPPSPVEFDFNHGRASPCRSSPSTPKGFKEFSFLSVPSSPARASEIYQEFDDFAFATTIEFEYDLNAAKHSETAIKSPLLYPQSSPRSKNSPAKKSLWSTFSPKRRKETKTKTKSNPFEDTKGGETGQERGREKVSTLSTSRSRTRSLSPLRVSKYPWEEELQNNLPSSSTPKTNSTAVIEPLKGSRKWRLKDLLLFRSASEGRAYEKDPLRKYADMYKRYEGAKKPVSAHELHYTVNKKVSEDMKKKSFLPYKQGILGRLAFNPTVHALAHGFGSLAHSHN